MARAHAVQLLLLALVCLHASQAFAPPKMESLFENIPAAVDACAPAKGRMVLSIAFFPNASTLFPYVRSWQMHSPHTRLVLFSNNKDVHSALHDPPYVHVVMSKNDFNLPWSSWRMIGYAFFLELCQSHGLVPQAAAVVDARDSLALSNVWEHPTAALAVQQNMVVAPLEGNPGVGGAPSDLIMSTEATNMMWMNRCVMGVWPQEALDYVARHPVSCSGVILGSGPAMLAYTRALMDLALFNSTADCLNIAGSDQGLHNFLVWWVMRHEGSVKISNTPVQVLTPHNGHAFVYTLQYGRPVEMNKFGMLKVVREGWQHLPAYLHQYDRDKDLAARIKELFKVSTTT